MRKRFVSPPKFLGPQLKARELRTHFRTRSKILDQTHRSFQQWKRFPIYPINDPSNLTCMRSARLQPCGRRPPLKIRLCTLLRKKAVLFGDFRFTKPRTLTAVMTGNHSEVIMRYEKEYVTPKIAGGRDFVYSNTFHGRGRRRCWFLSRRVL